MVFAADVLLRLGGHRSPLLFGRKASRPETRKELLKPRAFRRVEKLRRNAFLLDPALAQEKGAGGDVSRERHLVGDDDHGAAFRRQALHHGQHFAHEFRVERGGRLVEEDYARMNRERTGDRGALLLAARELARIGVRAMAEADLSPEAPSLLP